MAILALWKFIPYNHLLGTYRNQCLLKLPSPLPLDTWVVDTELAVNLLLFMELKNALLPFHRR